MKLPWTKKYAPEKLSEVIGQPSALQELVSFIKSFPASKAALLYGSPGVGKTASLHALASELGCEVLELNASDTRNKSSITETLLPASQQASIFCPNKLIIVDEIDGLSGTADRGGIPAVLEVIKQTHFPLVLTANDPFNKKLRSLRMACKLIQFKHLDHRSIAKKLKQICDTESLRYEEDALENLAIAAQGDLRAAINDLEMLGEGGKPISLDAVQLWGRAQDESIFNALKTIFKTYDSSAAFKAIDNLNEDYNMLSLWLDENLPREYSGSALRDAYSHLSHADLFDSRIRRWQHWRFLVYIRHLLVAGVQHSKEKLYPGYVGYQRPALLSKLFGFYAKRRREQAIMEKLSEVLHASTGRLRKDFLPFYAFVASRNKKMAGQLASQLGI